MKKLTNFLLTTLSIICIGFIIWLRFLRERLPREIPFNLSLLGLVIILFICALYILNIVYILDPKQTNINSISKKFKEYIYAPVNVIVANLIDSPKTYPHFEKYFFQFVKKLQIINHFKCYLILELLPQIILVSIFCLDIFYFHHLKYFYMILLLNIFIMGIKIILTICKYVMNRNINDVEEKAEIFCYTYVDPKNLGIVPIIPVKEFVH